jgi:hypothetical protein
MQNLIDMFGFSFVIADSSHCEDSLNNGFEDGTFFKQEFSRVSSKVENILYEIKESSGRDVCKYCISDFSTLSMQLKKAGYSWHSLNKKKCDIWIYFMPTAIHLDFRNKVIQTPLKWQLSMVWTVDGWECLLVVSLFQFAMILMVSVKFDILLVH